MLRFTQKAYTFASLTSRALSLASNSQYELGSSVSLREFEERRGGFEQVDLSLARSPNVLQVSGWAAVSAETSGRQRDEDGAFIFADTDHLSRLGAAKLAQDVGKGCASVPT